MIKGGIGKIKKLIKGPVSKKSRSRAGSPRDRQKKTSKSAIALIRAEENPIISPKAEHGWEAWQTFNPGVLALNDSVHFVYRAIGSDGLSRFGYARSFDGFEISERLPYPIYEHRLTPGSFSYYSFASGGSFGGCEDPRITRVGEDDVLYMTYTACDGGLRVGLTSIKLKDFLNKNWKWKSPALISQPGGTHKNWIIFPEKINGRYAILTSISPKILISYRDNLKFKEGEYLESRYESKENKNCWDSYIRGAGPPPIKTKDGWLLLYHAIDKRDPGKYKVGAMVLDASDPAKVLYYSKEPILEPDEYYENNGFKAGVVYASGAVIKDGNLLVYYGCADSYSCIAYANLDDFLGELKRESKPILKRQILRV